MSKVWIHKLPHCWVTSRLAVETDRNVGWEWYKAESGSRLAMVISVSAGIGPPRPGTFNIVHVANHFRAGCDFKLPSMFSFFNLFLLSPFP